MIKKVSRPIGDIGAQVTKPNGIELAAFRFMADGNGETHFKTEEGRWLRDTLEILLEQAHSPISFARSVECVHNRVITIGEFHANADWLLREYDSRSIHPSGDDDQRIM
jgi:hypothetical protein